jgi:hypothetical protein
MADIALADNKSKSLVFDLVEGCLQFANVFYETAKEFLILRATL